MTRPEFVLASGSASRARLCARAGLRFRQVSADVEECHIDGAPIETVESNARLKLDWAQAREPHATLVAADTVVAFSGEVVGKPETLDEAREGFRRFSGKSHRVLTCLGFSKQGQAGVFHTVESSVTFRELDEQAIDAYFALVNPLDKAGGYDIDQSSDLIVASYDGSYSNIVGLPMDLLIGLLDDAF